MRSAVRVCPGQPYTGSDFLEWGHSSAGRAPALQAGGRRFDPGWLHQLPRLMNGDARDDASSRELTPMVKVPTCAGVITRQRVISGDAGKRIVCSLTIRKVFVLTLSFQAKLFLLTKRVRLEMSRSQCESAPYPQTPWGYMVKRVSAYGGCLGGRRR